jgi:hypothetical protein
MGVYLLHGAFCLDVNKTIYGTEIPINASATMAPLRRKSTD